MADPIPISSGASSAAAATSAPSATGVAMRRSSRVSVALPVRLRSLDPKVSYSEECQTLVVNAHGCGIRSPQALPPGTRVEVEAHSSRRRANGIVLNCSSLSSDAWVVGVELEVAGNLWGLHPVPADWPTETSSRAAVETGRTTASASAGAGTPVVQHGALSFSPFASSRPPRAEPPASTSAAQASLDEQARELTAALAREAETAMAGLRRFVEECTTRNTEVVASALAEGRTAITRQVEASFRDAGEGLQQRMRAEFEQQMQQLRAEYDAARKELQAMHERGENLVSVVDLELQAHADEAVQDAVKLIQQDAAETVQQTKTQLNEAAEQTVRQLKDLLEELRQETRAGEAQTAVLRQQLEQARAWLTEETQKFKNQVHDAYIEAGGEIKGRMHAAIEGASGPIQRRAQELQEQIDQARAALAAEAAKFSDDTLKQRLSQTLQTFEQDAEKLARSSLERWQRALSESCKAIPDVLQRALDQEE